MKNPRPQPSRAGHANHMATQETPLRMTLSSKWAIWASFGLLAASGCLWLIARYALRTQGPFGELPSPLEPLSMKLHGVSLLFMLFFTGSVLHSHIRRAIRSHRNRVSGWLVIAMLVALSGSGEVLYYFASEQARPIWSEVHWITGLLFTLTFVLHPVIGRRQGRLHQ